jgi:hypothetical protein
MTSPRCKLIKRRNYILWINHKQIVWLSVFVYTQHACLETADRNKNFKFLENATIN